MRLLFDTNVLIYAEDPKEMRPELQELLSLIREYGDKILIHSSSLDDVSRDKDLLSLKEFRGIRILHPKNMMKLLE